MEFYFYVTTSHTKYSYFPHGLAFAQHLDTRTVDQSLQAAHAFLCRDDDLKTFFRRQIVRESGTFQSTLAS